ncbi:PREDICTED: S-adenosyl-L-methionine-dependent tRNA 4-demethylwyosine synthase-like, partial [Nanorana parkeri]|uniref:S-adenosyl-L-methionine-dependent tRNA 4-demethylwyosine synthase-like n=1 Tax=Nanorana parkeri TaxID=125878 RepID=UPI000854D9CA
MELESVALLVLIAAARVTAQSEEDASSGPWVFVHTHLMLLWMNRFYIYTCAAIGITAWICSHFFMSGKSHQGEALSQNGSLQGADEVLKNNTEEIPKEKQVFVSGVKIFYGSQTGTAKGFAHVLAEDITPMGLPVEIINLKDYDPDDNLVEEGFAHVLAEDITPMGLPVEIINLKDYDPDDNLVEE